MTPDKVTAQPRCFTEQTVVFQIEDLDRKRATFFKASVTGEIVRAAGVSMALKMTDFVQNETRECNRIMHLYGVQWLPADETLAGVDARPDAQRQRGIQDNDSGVPSHPGPHRFANERMEPRIVIDHINDGLQFRWVGEPRQTRRGGTCAGGEECGAQCHEAVHDE